jgi:protein-tyrosine phosphatase
MGRSGDAAADILFVCHANLCRSPLAERIAGPLLARRGIVVASAGTHAYSGLPMHPDAEAALRERGLTGADFRSRRLRAEHVAAAALILTATREQRAMCVALAPSTIHRTFTIAQFGRIAATIHAAGPLDIADLLRAVPAARAELPAVATDQDDLRDPFGGTPADMRACLVRIATSLRPVLRLISGSPLGEPERSAPQPRQSAPR